MYLPWLHPSSTPGRGEESLNIFFLSGILQKGKKKPKFEPPVNVFSLWVDTWVVLQYIFAQFQKQILSFKCNNWPHAVFTPTRKPIYSIYTHCIMIIMNLPDSSNTCIYPLSHYMHIADDYWSEIIPTVFLQCFEVFGTTFMKCFRRDLKISGFTLCISTLPKNIWMIFKSQPYLH